MGISSHITNFSEIEQSNIDYQEYYLIKENIIYKIVLFKNENTIIIKCKNYMISFNHHDLSILTNHKYISIDKAYDFILNLFEENKVLIKNIKIGSLIQLKIIQEKIFELSLIYDKKNSSLIFNILNETKNQYKNKINMIIKSMKEKFNILADKINQLKLEINALKFINKNANIELEKFKNKFDLKFDNQKSGEKNKNIYKDLNYEIINQKFQAIDFSKTLKELDNDSRSSFNLESKLKVQELFKGIPLIIEKGKTLGYKRPIIKKGKNFYHIPSI